MLQSLHVKNIALIDELEIDFGKGLNVLSGETGSGKSIIIGSINTALGAKVSKEVIRRDADYALIELVFTDEEEELRNLFEQNGLQYDDGMVVLSRKILAGGKSTAKINGETVSLSILKQIASALVNIHGQNEHQSLLYSSNHIDIVDRFVKENIADLKNEIKENYELYTELRAEYENALCDEAERLREISFLKYAVSEIETAKLVEGEEEELFARHKLLVNGKNLVEGISTAYNLVSEGNESATERMGRAARQLSKLSEYDERVSELIDKLACAEDILRDFTECAREYIYNLDNSEEELAAVEQRLDLIRNMKAKYGNTISTILAYGEEAGVKLSKYEDYDAYVENMSMKLEKLSDKLEKLSDKLSVERQKGAKVLSEKITAALKELNFLDVRFEIRFNRLEKYTSNGFDEIEFFISTNPGEPIMPLSKVASGGELSRIMLAIKSVLADKDDVGTLIFDEIDTGISGRTAQKVAERLVVISAARQVLCITHLPQLAAMADCHYLIEKTNSNDRTNTSIKRLNPIESEKEVARILGGVEITEHTLESAGEMRSMALKFKESLRGH